MQTSRLYFIQTELDYSLMTNLKENKPIQYLFSWRWVLGFLVVIVIALALRQPFLRKGHGDEVHTIGRALNIIYTGDLNPHFFLHPTGTMYLMIVPDIVSLASISRDAGGRPGVQGSSPLEIFRQNYPNPAAAQLFENPVSNLWDEFRYKVRRFNVMLIPVQILLLAYIGYRLNLMAPALAAAVLLAFCGSSIRDSVYVSVNTTTATFVLLSVAVCAYYVQRTEVFNLKRWLKHIGFLSLIVGLAVACKYNAGTFLLVPLLYGALTLPQLPDRREYGEKMLLALGVSALGLTVGFTVLCPYWYKELGIFIRDVLYQVWYFKVGHKDYNTFEPGLQMFWVNLRCLADHYTWIGLIATVLSWGYLLAADVFPVTEERKHYRTLLPALAGCVGFFMLMSNQAVFFDRNFSIFWSAWFLLSATGWWLAARSIAELWNLPHPQRIQNIFLWIMLAICVIEANFIDAWLFSSTRDWWRVNNTVLNAIDLWFR